MSAASNETQRAERPGEQPRARPDTGRLRWPLSAQMTDWARTEPSYWADTAPLERPGVPLTEEVRVDVAIIGGGFTGLSTALSLSRDYNVSCAVLEGGEVGWGSSGRNGGLVMLDCTKLSLHEMFQRVGVSDTAKYFASQVEAVRLVQATIAEEAIDCDVVLEHGLTAATSPKRLESLRSEAALLRGTLGIDAQILNAQELQERFVDSPALHGALSVGPGMVLHPLKLAIGLARAVERRGADLYVNAPILAWEQDGGDHVLHSRHGRVRARWVTLATNGFTPDRLHSSFDGRMAPVISNIGVTRVLTRDELAAHNLQSFAPMIDDRHLLRYFRLLPDGRLLLGMRGRDTGSAEGVATMRETVRAGIDDLFPALADAPIEYFWRGPIGITSRRTPCLGRLTDDPSVVYGFGYHGNGVNTAIWTGAVLAQLIAEGDATLEAVPRLLRGLSPRFPVPALRPMMTGVAMRAYGLKDRFGS